MRIILAMLLKFLQVASVICCPTVAFHLTQKYMWVTLKPIVYRGRCALGLCSAKERMELYSCLLVPRSQRTHETCVWLT